MTMKKSIVLKPITAENLAAALDLQLEEHQKPYVMHPMRSLAHAYVYRDSCYPFGIYDGDKMVGYSMIRHNPEIKACTIWHLLIDKAYQKQGYGSSALMMVIKQILAMPFGIGLEKILIACHPENDVAYRLYLNFGFIETGRGENIELELKLNPST